MLSYFRTLDHEAAVVRAVFLWICGTCLASAQNFMSAQNFTTRTADLSPFGVNGPLPFGETPDFAGGKVLKGGFAYGVGLSTNYDSNILLTEDDPDGDVSLILAPTLSYTSDPEGGAPMVITANYSPSATAYLNNSEFNSIDQSGNIAMVVSGSRTTISAFAGVSQNSGADSLAASQGFFTGTSLSLGLQASYQLAPRTSIVGGCSSTLSDYGSGSVEGASATGYNGYSANLGGFWSATERLSFGPNFSYSNTTSDNTGDINSYGFSMQGAYKVSEKIQVAASIGAQYSQYSLEGSSGDITPMGSLNASYQINELWSWSNSIQSGLTPAPTQADYLINNWFFATMLNRQFLEGSAGVGLNYQLSNYKSIGPAGPPLDNQQNLSLILSYQRPLFLGRVDFNSSFYYAINSGQGEWSQIQLNLGLSTQF